MSAREFADEPIPRGNRLRGAYPAGAPDLTLVVELTTQDGHRTLFAYVQLQYLMLASYFTCIELEIASAGVFLPRSGADTYLGIGGSQFSVQPDVAEQLASDFGFRWVKVEPSDTVGGGQAAASNDDQTT